MYTHSEYETWLTERGDEIIDKKAKVGLNSLTKLEHLIYCVWIVDYSIRNAGDLSAAEDLYPPFKEQGQTFAKQLQLDKPYSYFTLDTEEMTEQYFLYFETICTQLISADQKK